jgi:hypothetical protein
VAIPPTGVDFDAEAPAPRRALAAAVGQSALGCKIDPDELDIFLALWFSRSLALVVVEEGPEGYRGVGAKSASAPLPAAKGLPLFDLKLRLRATPGAPGGDKKDMLEGVDIKLEGELDFRGRFWILTAVTWPGALLPPLAAAPAVAAADAAAAAIGIGE